jgi:hypothetical protein
VAPEGRIFAAIHEAMEAAFVTQHRKFALPLLPSYAALMKADDPFWQRKYYAFQIYSRQKLEEKLTYNHLNPVRAVLVARAADWRWSSARHYKAGRTVGVPITWVY